MKLAKITFVRGMFIPGHGNVVSLENVEVEGTSIPVATAIGGRMPVHGLVIVTSTAKVLIPWERVESVVTEWIKLPPAALTARAALRAGGMGELIPRPDGQELASLATVAQGAKAHGTGMFAHVERAPGMTLAEAQAMKDAAQNRLGGEQGSNPDGMASTTPSRSKTGKDVEATSDGPLGEVAPAIRQPPPPSKKGGRR